MNEKFAPLKVKILLVWGLNSMARCFQIVGGLGGNGCGKHSMQILWSLNINAKLKKTSVGFVWVRCFACALQSPDSIAKCEKPSHKNSGFKGLEGGRASNGCWKLCVDFAELQHHQYPQRFNSKCYCLMFALPTTTPIYNPPSQILTCLYCRRHSIPSLSAFWCPICNQKNN
jgi:hypothetical protein